MKFLLSSIHRTAQSRFPYPSPADAEVARASSERLPPNAETIAAMKEARAGNLPRFNDVQSLLDDLNAED